MKVFPEHDREAFNAILEEKDAGAINIMRPKAARKAATKTPANMKMRLEKPANLVLGGPGRPGYTAALLRAWRNWQTHSV